tara:strand:- start:342 stop:461 length:120 start_codon:yes stop_codon:yes gene_type:complete
VLVQLTLSVSSTYIDSLFLKEKKRKRKRKKEKRKKKKEK